MPEPRELDPMAAGLIKANLTSDEFATDRILTRAVEADLDGLFSAFTMTNRDGFAAFAKGDFAVLTDLFAEDLLWHDSGRNQLSGDYRGRDAVFGLFGKLMEVTEGSLRIGLHALFADDERGVALVSSRPAGAAGASRSGKRTSSTCATARWWLRESRRARRASSSRSQRARKCTSYLLWLTCLAPSADVRRHPLVSAVVVTQLVTHRLRAPPASDPQAVPRGHGPRICRLTWWDGTY
jgi:ketosteroid isomerase-like protein